MHAHEDIAFVLYLENCGVLGCECINLQQN